MGLCLLAQPCFNMGALSASPHPLMNLDTRSILVEYVFLLMGLCLLELFNGASFNGARTLLMGLTLLQMFNGVFYLLAKLLMGLCLLAY